MNKISLLLFSLCALMASVATSCDDDNKRLDGDAKIYINGRNSANKSLGRALTAHEVCCREYVFMTLYADDNNTGGRFFDIKNGEIDTINNRLIMEAGNIDMVAENVFLNRPYVIITDGISFDTLGYVPYAQRQAAIPQLQKLYDREDWNGLYKMFQESFEFIPCTGAEYKELKARGEY